MCACTCEENTHGLIYGSGREPALTQFPSESHTGCYQNKKPTGLGADSRRCVTSAPQPRLAPQGCSELHPTPAHAAATGKGTGGAAPLPLSTNEYCGCWGGQGEQWDRQQCLQAGIVLPALPCLPFPACPHPACPSLPALTCLFSSAAGSVRSVPAVAGRSTPATGCGERGATPTTSPASPASPASGSSPPARSSAWWRRRCSAGSTTTP